MGIERLPLPRITGPKLKPFRGTATVDIEFIAFIGNDQNMDSKVWKVRIDGKVYALKVVSVTSCPPIWMTGQAALYTSLVSLLHPFRIFLPGSMGAMIVSNADHWLVVSLSELGVSENDGRILRHTATLRSLTAA